MNLDAKRLNAVLMGLVGLAVVVLFLGVYMAGKVLQAKSNDVAAAHRANLVAERKLQLLSKAQAGIEKYEELAEVARSIVPQDKDQAQTVREVVNLATGNGIQLSEITFPNSSLGTAGAADGQLKAAPGISGVYSLEIIVRSDSSNPPTFSNFLAFLKALENNRRTALVTGINLEPDDKNPSRVNFTLTINEYIKP